MASEAQPFADDVVREVVDEEGNHRVAITGWFNREDVGRLVELLIEWCDRYDLEEVKAAVFAKLDKGGGP